MIRVKLTTSFPHEPIIRQTPGYAGRWGECQFFVDDDTRECDFWVVYEGPVADTTAVCAPENVLLITGEPLIKTNYPAEFLRQFHEVITCHPQFDHPHVHITQQSLPWHVGMKAASPGTPGQSWGYDDFSAQDFEAKDRLMAVICSNKSKSVAHKTRLDFALRLKEHFGDRLDFFGRGFQEIDDKMAGLARYKYALVLENSQVPHYWTEKLADAFLTNCFPFYLGCPNISSYFDRESLLELSPDWGAAAAAMEDALARDVYTQSRAAVSASKRRVLGQYNLFSLVEEMVRSRPVGRGREITLRTQQAIRHSNRLWGWLPGGKRGRNG